MIVAAVDQAARSARFIEAKRMALALIERDVDYIQDPDTGRLEGSHPQGGDGSSGGESGSAPTAFVSPNIGNLTFGQAVAGLSSPRQKVLTAASNDIDTQLGKQPASAQNVVGAWSDGAENSLLLKMPGWTTGEARVALAMKGWIGDQKSVLLFTPDHNGSAFVASFKVKGEIASIHKELLGNGLAFHTLEPILGGAVVHVYGDDQKTVNSIDRAAGANETKAEFIAGDGEFLGTSKSDGTDREQRDDARKKYEAVISEASSGSEFSGRDLGKTWNEIRDRWGRTLSEIKLAAGLIARDVDFIQDPTTGRLEGSHPQGGGSGGSEGGTSGGDGKHEHPGAGYSSGAYVKDGVIHTSNVYDAQRALFEDRKVELKQPSQVSTLIKRLGETAKEMEKAGEKAPVFNLCNVTVAGTNLFCADTKGIPRVEMPVIPAKQTKDFIKYLKDQGYKVDKEKEYAAHLRATQSEISGAKVADAMKRIEKEGFYKRLVVSRDNYILDGHHTWAGQLGVDAKNNNLHDDKSVKVARVDISITKLIAAAEKFTGGKGKKPADEAAKSAAQVLADLVRIEDVIATARVLIARDVDYIQDPTTGRLEGSHPQGGGDSGSGGSDKPGESKPSKSSSASSGGGDKKKAEIADFAKDDVALDTTVRVDGETQKKFIDTWNEKIAEAPADFRKSFLGGVNGSMRISFKDRENAMVMSGALLDATGKEIGEYRRTIDFDDKKASSDYFKLNNSATGHGIGKQVLAGNVAMYQKLGLEKVEVHADIDVGGHAWARYGYVPTRMAWSGLSDEIMNEIDKRSSGGSGGSYEASSWEELSSHQQNKIESAWMEAGRQEFIDSEIDNWRENGEALQTAKTAMVESFNASVQDWGEHAIDGYRKQREESGEPPIPFDNYTLLSAINLDFNSRYENGEGDLDVTFDDAKLTSPSGVDPAQPSLPNLPTVEPHEHLTESMRDGLTTALDKAFEREADSKADDIEPPSYIADNVGEMQSEYWDQMDEEDRFKWAERNEPDLITSEGESEGSGEIDDEDANRLRTLAASNDPKAVWAIADSKYGKQILLGQDWYGEMNLKDKETMDRFNAYVGKAKAAA